MRRNAKHGERAGAEYGIFSDEGLLEGDFYSRADAEKAAAEYDADDEAVVEEVCHEHRDQPADGCEECDADEDEDADDEEDVEEPTKNGRLPSHLRFLEDFTGLDGNLEDFFPESASGKLKPRAHEQIFEADGIGYIGDKDGTMVPVDAENVEPMEENIWDAAKFSALVAAVKNGDEPIVYPGYADLWEEGGQVHAQVRDGNHRAFAPIVAGSDFTWVMISDNVRQDLDEGKLPGLYKAIRAAQKAAGAPLLKKKVASKLRGGARANDQLAQAEAEYAALKAAELAYYQAMLKKFGGAQEAPHPLSEQLERPQTFWRLRLNELHKTKSRDWFVKNLVDSAESQQQEARSERASDVHAALWDLRKTAGLDPRLERLDPVTKKVVQQNSSRRGGSPRRGAS